MKNFVLNVEQVLLLREELKDAIKRSPAKNAYRINVVILLGTGWTLGSVAKAFFLDEETLRSYVKKYRDGGINELLKNEHAGTNAKKLSPEQEAQLTQHLIENLYRKTIDIIKYVRKQYQVTYTRSGMTALLHTIGFTYKKPKLIPEKLDVQAQDEFLELLYDFESKMPENEALFFYDSAHPTYSTIADYGWIQKGSDSFLPSPPSRQRVNISGAVELKTLDVITTFPEKVNAETTIEFLKKLLAKYFEASKIHIILDNAPYHHALSVKEYAEANNINLIFLPPYSPNLNLAERLWAFMRRQVLATNYFESFQDFKKAIVRFFRGIKNRRDALEKLMTFEFQEFNFASSA